MGLVNSMDMTSQVGEAIIHSKDVHWHLKWYPSSHQRRKIQIHGLSIVGKLSISLIHGFAGAAKLPSSVTPWSACPTSGGNTNPSSAFGTFSPLTRGEGRSIGGSREISQPSTLRPRDSGGEGAEGG